MIEAGFFGYHEVPVLCKRDVYFVWLVSCVLYKENSLRGLSLAVAEY